MKVEGLPTDATIEDVRNFALHIGQVVSLEMYGLSQCLAEKNIRQLLEPPGTLQELRFAQSHDECWYNVYVQIPGPDVAVTAVLALTGDIIEILQTPVRVKLKVSITFLSLGSSTRSRPRR